MFWLAELTTQTGILKASSHPVALFFLFFFRSAAIAVYVLCGLCELAAWLWRVSV